MRLRAFVLGLAVALLWASSGMSQGVPTGRVSGRVTSEGQPLPGVLVSATSPNLQGARTTSTGDNGDYNLPALPPGDYTVTFELTGLETVTRQLRIGASQSVPLDTEMTGSAFAEEILVTGELEQISQDTEVSTTYTQNLINELPIGRTVNDIVALAPGVQPNGPAKSAETGLGSITISGAPSFENLFLINGVVINENIRGQANDLFIEDAIQETTTSSGSISAEYGRFSGGVVNVITKSGGNDFSGSLRSSLTNQDWEEETPLTTVQKDDIIPVYEATLGGPILRDRIWFFLAGRSLDRSDIANTTLTNIAYETGREEQRYEGKLTASITPQHTLIGSYMKLDETQLGNSFPPVLDLRSIYDRETPEELFSVNYTGTFSDSLLLTAQYSERQFTFIGSGAQSRDLIEGTMIIARQLGNGRYWSPTFCGVCEDEERDNENLLAKANYFLTTESFGSHDLVAGYDTFNDIRKADNHQSGSDYRILGTSAIIRNGGQDIFPVFANDGTTIIQYNPILRGSEGTDFKTNSIFVNDSWRFNDRLSFNLGVRYDENDGRDAEGKVVAKDDNISPRVAASFDPFANGNWVFNASYGRYVAALANSIADSTSAAGSPATFQWTYRGPSVNTDPNGALVRPDEALRILFNWFINQNGGPNGNLPLLGVNIPGGSTIIRGSLNSPHVDEYSIGMTGRIGTRGLFRADLIHREWGDFYISRTDLSTGQVQTSNGRVDLTVLENGDDFYERTYDGVHTQFRYRASDSLDFGGNYTWSHTEGNYEGENRTSGPVSGGFLSYPEYGEARWNAPVGDLGIDQRHRASLYGIYRIFSNDRNELSVSLLQSYFSGRAYEEAGVITLIDPVTRANYVRNPGYVTPPTRVTYFFGERGELRTQDIYRTDISFNYGFQIGGVDLFLQPEVVNVFNAQRIDTTATNLVDFTILTADNRGTCSQAGAGGAPGPCRAFNPFTETPIEGVHWQRGPNFGKAINPLAYQTPRTFRVSVGLRF